MSKLLDILKSRLPKKMEAFEFDRISICNKCEFNSKNTKNKFLINIIYKIINFMNTHCTICGCGIKYKVRVKTGVCSLYDIDKEPKWNRVLTNNL